MYGKKWAGFLLILFFVAGMVFAGGQGESAAAADGPVTLNVLNYGDMATAEGQSWETLMEQFAEAYPEIQVQSETLYDEAYHQKATASLVAGEVPHIMYLWPGPRSSYAFDAEVVIDQRDYIDTNKFTEAAMAPQGANGEIWEVPLNVGITSVLFVNKAALAELGLEMPKTYADLKAMVEPAKAAGKIVLSLAGGEAWVNNSCYLGTAVGRFAGPGFIDAAVRGEKSFTDPAFVKALEFLGTMVQDGVLPRTTVQTDYGTALSNFVNGKALFMLDGHWRSGAIEDAAFASNVGMAVLPAIPGENARYAGSASGVVSPGYALTTAAVEGDPKVLDAAKKLLMFIAGEQGSAVRFAAMGWLPAYKMDLDWSVVDSEAARITGQEKADLYNNVPLLTDVPDAFIPAAANDVLNTGMQEILLGERTAAEVTASLEEAMNR